VYSLLRQAYLSGKRTEHNRCVFYSLGADDLSLALFVLPKTLREDAHLHSKELLLRSLRRRRSSFMDSDFMCVKTLKAL